ncbi:MAG: hypothetical protein WC878_07980 [Candidatus Paceibacterota bacterium]|jgi:hypothetical protein
MNTSEYANDISVSSPRPPHETARHIVPLFVFLFLLLLNGFIWFDYTTRKYKISLIRQDVRTLLSATEEEQKKALQESKEKLGVFEEEHSVLLGDLASSTNMLAAAQAEILNHDLNMALVASTTDLEKEKNAALSREIAEIKNIMLPL